MLDLSTWNRRKNVVRLSCLVVAALAIAAAGRPALAVVPNPTGFKLDISSSPRVLDALDMKDTGEITASEYYEIKYDEACDNPHLRIRARNKPAIMIRNYPTESGQLASVAPITSFSLTINDGPYAFGTGDGGDNFTNFIKNTIYTDAGVTITGSSVSNSNKTLTVTFDGLTAGKKAIFNVDLDSTDPNGFMYPDYRMALFGAPLPGEDPTDPATTVTTFTSPTAAPNTKSFTLTFAQQTATPEWANEDIRSYSAMDPIEVTGLGVPEPTSVSMALAGVAALAMRFRKSRKVA